MSTHSSSLDRVAVIGAGPAGMSAALWLQCLGFYPVLIESANHPGGMQRFNFLKNEWLLGQINVTGPELCEKFVTHMAEKNIPLHTSCVVQAIQKLERDFSLTLRTDFTRVVTNRYRAIIIATGLRYRAEEVLISVPGFETLEADDVAYGPYAFLATEGCEGKRVLIVGGGDNAFENAIHLLRQGAEVFLVCRSTPRAQARLCEEAESFGQAWRSYRYARIQKFCRTPDGIEVLLSYGERKETLRVQRIHVLAGYMPNTTFLGQALGPLHPALRFDAAGYLEVDSWGRTSIAGIYAAGDVCNPDFPNVVSAIASGAKAAKAVEIDSRADRA